MDFPIADTFTDSLARLTARSSQPRHEFPPAGEVCGPGGRRIPHSAEGHEDLHWVDGETQALLEGLVESVGSARLLLLVTYRPGYEHR